MYSDLPQNRKNNVIHKLKHNDIIYLKFILSVDNGRRAMSLGIAFKGPEGIVLAADSRVTLTTEIPNEKMFLPSTFDNATKLLQVAGQEYVGAVTYGLGAIGTHEPRTAHSLLPELEEELSLMKTGRLSVEDFAKKLSSFFVNQWNKKMPNGYSGPDMVFLIGGFNENEPYGKVYKVGIPSIPTPQEQNIDLFGIVWGGQLEYTTRLIKGFDPKLPLIIKQFLELTEEKRVDLEQHLERSLSCPIPYQFLPLQDCVDLSIFLIRTTTELQNWTIGIRGVGGAIDVATITRTEGLKPVQQKTIIGQKKNFIR